MAETYTKIFNEIELPDTFGGFLVFSLEENNMLIYCHCGNKRDYIKIEVYDVIAYQVYDEFTHPYINKDKKAPVPPYSNSRDKIFYPALQVNNSEWLSSFSQAQLVPREEHAEHYQFLSSSNIVDVITCVEPSAFLVSKDEYTRADEFINKCRS